VNEATRTFAGQWLEAYGDKLYAFALARVGGDTALAEDLLQETLLAGMRGYKAFRHKASVETWLIGILRRKIVDHHRQRNRRNKEVPLDMFFSTRGHIKDVSAWGYDASQVLEDKEFMETLDACLQDLGAPLAEAFYACAVDELSTEQACSLLGITPTNLSVRLHRARLALRRCLEMKWFRSP